MKLGDKIPFGLAGALLAGLLVCWLCGCGTAPVVQTKTIVAEAGQEARDVPPAVDAAAGAGRKANEAGDANLSQISAGAGVIVDVNSQQPPGAIPTAVDGEARAIVQRAGAARPQDAAAAAQRALVAKSGDLVKVQAQNASLVADAAAARKLLEDLRRDYDAKVVNLQHQVAEAQAEAKQIQGQMQARIDEVQANADQRIAAADQRAKDAEEKARKWWLNVLHLILLGLGVVGLLVGAATLYLSKGSEWIRAALAAGCGGLCFVIDWSLGQWWMKWAVIGGTALTAIAVAIYVITELRSHKTVERLAAAAEAEKARLAALQADVDPKLEAAKKIITQFDAFYESAPKELQEQLDPQFAELRGKMDKAERDAVHALRYEANTNAPATPAAAT